MEDTRSWIPVAFTAVAASVLYYSGMLAFLFAVPVQFVLVRYGREAGFKSAIAAGASIILGRVFLVIRLTGGLSGAYGGLLMDAMMPLGILTGVMLFNQARSQRWPQRLVIASLVAIAGSYPILRMVVSTGPEADALRVHMANAMQMFGVVLESDVLVDYVRRVILHSIGAAMVSTIAATWWFGTSLALRPAGGAIALITARVDDSFVWLLIGGMALVVGGWLLQIHWVLVAIGWNATAIGAFLFGIQGLGILQYIVLTRTGKPHLTRLVITFAILALIIPGTNVAVMFGLPLLGVSELWVNFRRRRGHENHSQ